MSGSWVRRDIAFVQQNLTYGFPVCCYWPRTQKVEKKERKLVQKWQHNPSAAPNASSWVIALSATSSLLIHAHCTPLLYVKVKKLTLFPVLRSLLVDISHQVEVGGETNDPQITDLVTVIGNRKHQGNLKVPEMKCFVLPFYIQHMNKPFLPPKYIAATLFTAFLELMSNWNSQALWSIYKIRKWQTM